MKNMTSIGVKKETLKKLYNAKFDIRVNTFDQVINELLKEHENRKNDRQQNIHKGVKK
jgi:hypothetical protein